MNYYVAFIDECVVHTGRVKEVLLQPAYHGSTSKEEVDAWDT
jgi:hypothetical protein